MGAFCPDNGAYARRWDLSVLFVLLLSEMSIPETQHLQSYTQIPILEICKSFHPEALSSCEFSGIGAMCGPATPCVRILYANLSICLRPLLVTDLSGRNAFNKRHHHYHHHPKPLPDRRHYEQLPSSSSSSSSSSKSPSS